MNRVLLFVLLSVVCWHSCQSHICLIQPRQRGAIDIHDAGDSTCFQPTPPCGKQPARDPTDVYMSGDTILVKFQQNYNHYEPGLPGYLDLAVADIQNMSQFTTIAIVNDFYAHAQHNQRNYTVIAQLPAITCDHCVLRVRYNPHKPTEPIFHQCGDIRITKSGESVNRKVSDELCGHSSLPKISLLQTKATRNRADGSLWGFSYSPVELNMCTYVTVDPMSGVSIPLQTFPFGFGGGEPGFLEQNYMIDQVFAMNINVPGEPRIVGIMQNKTDLDTTPTTWMNFVADSGKLLSSEELMFPEGSFPINGLIPSGPDSYYAVQIKADTSKPGSYFFQISAKFSNDDTLRAITVTPTSEDTYVNYQWAEYHPMLNTIIVLMGNENDADGLTCRLYFFPLDSPGQVSVTDIDVSQFTFMSFHVSNTNPAVVYALSPGLNGQMYPAWHLVTINLSTGNVTEIHQVAPAGFFQGYYGGGVMNGLDQDSGIIHYVLRVADSDNVDVILRVNIMTGDTMMSSPTSLRHVHNLAYYNPN